MFNGVKVFDFQDINQYMENLSGNNQKRLFVGIPIAEDNETTLLFLSKIFAAVNIDIQNDIVLLKQGADMRPSFIQIQSLYGFDRSILFGLKPADLGLHFQAKLYLPTNIQNISFLCCDRIERIQSDINLKKNLWEAMKGMF